MTLAQSHIYLHNMRLYAYHGVLPQERVVGAEYVVSIDVVCDVSKAVQTDQVDDTVNYAVLRNIAQREMAEPSSLLEHVAGRIARAVSLTYPQVEEVVVDIRKVRPPYGGEDDGAGVKLQFINTKD